MKTTNLILAIESEKLAALRQYATKKDVNIEDELSDAVDKLYEKIVPPAVREYIAERVQAAPSKPVRPPRSKSVSQPTKIEESQ